MKRILVALVYVGFAQSAQASAPASEYVEAPSNLKFVLSGTLDTQAGYRSQKKEFNKDAIDGSTLHKSAIINETRLVFDIQGKTGGLKYGGYVQIYADASSHYVGPHTRIGKKVYTFVETKYGRTEIGGGDSATKQMQVSANNIARLPGGINGRASKWISEFVYLFNTSDRDKAGRFNSHFIKWPLLPTDNEHEAAAGKVTYFTPKVSGFQVGASYIIDSALNGTDSKTQRIPEADNKEYNNIFDGAVKYEGKFNEIEFAIALIGQIGKAKRRDLPQARNNLRAWELGAMAKYHGFSLAGSYSDWHHSGANKNKITGLKYGASYWTAGVGYEQGDIGTSITYFNSRRANINNAHPVTTDPRFYDAGFNRFELVSLGADYKLAPGFMPYAEFSFFRTKYKGVILSNKGTVALVGTKLAF